MDQANHDLHQANLPQNSRQHDLGTVANRVDGRVLHDNSFVAAKKNRPCYGVLEQPVNVVNTKDHGCREEGIALGLQSPFQVRQLISYFFWAAFI